MATSSWALEQADTIWCPFSSSAPNLEGIDVEKEESITPPLQAPSARAGLGRRKAWM